MPTVTYPNGKKREVANLGWLYRNTRGRSAVSGPRMHVELMTASALMPKDSTHEARLIVTLWEPGVGEVTYESTFASRIVLCQDFLKLPRWRRYKKTYV